MYDKKYVFGSQYTITDKKIVPLSVSKEDLKIFKTAFHISKKQIQKNIHFQKDSSFCSQPVPEINLERLRITKKVNPNQFIQCLR
jgi:hypothetical protein